MSRIALAVMLLLGSMAAQNRDFTLQVQQNGANIFTAARDSYVVLNFTGAGNPCTATGITVSCAFGAASQVSTSGYTSAGDYGQQVTAAEAASVCSGTGCALGTPPGTYSFTGDFQVGNSTTKIPVNLFLQPGVKITSNTSDGSNPICVAEGSSIGGWGGVAGTGGGIASEFLLGATANVSNFFQACNQTGATQGFRLSGLTLHANSGAQISGAMLDFKGQFSGSGADHITINGFNSGYGFRVWADSSTTVGATVLNFSDLVVAGATGNASGKPVGSIQASTTGGKIVEDITGTNDSFENCSAGQPCLEFDGHAAGNGDFRLYSNNFRGIHIESGGQSTSDGVKMADTHSLYMDSISFSDPGNRAMYTYETFLQTVTNLHAMGSNASWPITWQNWVNAAGSSTLNGSVSAGASTLTFNAATNLLPGSPIEVRDGTSTEFVTTASTYTAGSTTVTIAGTLANNHNNGITVLWNPEEYSGPGSGGVNNVLTSSVGGMVRDGNGVVDVTTTANHTLFEGERVFIWNGTADATLNGVYQVNVGAQCVDGAGAAGVCNANQFEYQSATHSTFTSTLTDKAYYATVRNFNFDVAGDDTVDGFKNTLHQIASPTRWADGNNPMSIEIDGFRLGAQGTPQYNRLFIGMADPLRSQAQPAGMVGSDFYIGTDYNVTTAQGFVLPKFHFGSFEGQDACMMRAGVDFLCLTADGNVTLENGAQLVGGAAASYQLTPQGPGASGQNATGTAYSFTLPTIPAGKAIEATFMVTKTGSTGSMTVEIDYGPAPTVACNQGSATAGVWFMHCKIMNNSGVQNAQTNYKLNGTLASTLMSAAQQFTGTVNLGTSQTLVMKISALTAGDTWQAMLGTVEIQP